jgi:uncharacterized lipoprotein YmbA
MKSGLKAGAVAALVMMAACQSSPPQGYYANPVDACKNEETQEKRDECMQNVVADVAISVKRESERKPPR